MVFSNEIIKMLNEFGKNFGVVIDPSQHNVMAQIQDFMGRYVLYETYTSKMWLVVGAIMVLIGIGLWWGSVKGKIYDIEEFIICIYAVLLAVGVAVVLTQVYDIIKVNTIPEECFMDYIKGLTLR